MIPKASAYGFVTALAFCYCFRIYNAIEREGTPNGLAQAIVDGIMIIGTAWSTWVLVGA